MAARFNASLRLAISGFDVDVRFECGLFPFGFACWNKRISGVMRRKTPRSRLANWGGAFVTKFWPTIEHTILKIFNLPQSVW
jgi:hypothetical protein